MTKFIGLLIIGNLIDNFYNPKKIIIILQISGGLLLTFVYLMTLVVLSNYTLLMNANFNFLDLVFLIGQGINIISIIQLRNWFPHTQIYTVLSLYQLAHFGTHLFYDFILRGEKLSIQLEGLISLGAGISFLILAFVDAKLFKFHPLQKNVLIDYDNKDEEYLNKIINASDGIEN